jgi:hypothetical protein
MPGIRRAGGSGRQENSIAILLKIEIVIFLLLCVSSLLLGPKGVLTLEFKVSV